MKLHLSRFALLVPLDGDRVAVVDALGGDRLVLTRDSAAIAEAFKGGARSEIAVAELASRLGLSADLVAGAVAGLLERGILTRLGPDAQNVEARLAVETLRRDPDAAARRRAERDRSDYWAVKFARNPEALGVAGGRAEIQILLIGDCDVHLEADFLEMEAAKRGISLRAITGGKDELRTPHDAIIVGALASRHTITIGTSADHGGDPSGFFIAELRDLLTELRAGSDAPIIVDGLPLPTVQPLGRADRGRHSHRNRFRAANLALEDLAQSFADVWIADVDAAVAVGGAAHLLDDALVHFTHFGSSGWLLQRPASELSSVHGISLPLEGLRRLCRDDPYLRERALAREHLDIIAVALGIERIKCVVVDLDGVLWPGVLAETGSPFAYRPDASSPYSFVGVWFGIHEALKALKRRGILLACASRNDESVVRELWRYSPHDPADRLLAPEDFATLRIGWNDKAESIAEIAEELGVAVGAMALIDDNPRERAAVAAAHPGIVVFEDEIAGLRKTLLSDPRLMPSRISDEAHRRSQTPARNSSRAALRARAADPAAFRASLEMAFEVGMAGEETEIARAAELFERTTQFNLSGQTFGTPELARLAGEGALAVGRYGDRFGDEGIVAAAVVRSDRILNLVVSCRVAGLGIDRDFLEWIVASPIWHGSELAARFIATDRNRPICGLLPACGFTPSSDSTWIYSRGRRFRRGGTSCSGQGGRLEEPKTGCR
ncbi:MAG: hypothetical protein QOJ94_2317 [Sphingomonadales bacterium]|nr:hypothetical protein [Sphingomonadales bacterium]